MRRLAVGLGLAACLAAPPPPRPAADPTTPAWIQGLPAGGRYFGLADRYLAHQAGESVVQVYSPDGSPPKRIAFRDAGELYDADPGPIALDAWAEAGGHLWVPAPNDRRLWLLDAELRLAGSVRVPGRPVRARPQLDGARVEVDLLDDPGLVVLVEIARREVTGPFPRAASGR